MLYSIFPTQFRSQNLIFYSEYQISHFSGFFPEIFWKSGNSPEFAFFHQFLCMGHHFHLISVTEIDFALRISNLKIFLDFFQEIFWISGNFPEFAMFGQFQCMGHHFHSIVDTEIDFALRISNFHIFLEFFHSVLVTELNFELRISNFQFFWIFFWKYSGNLENHPKMKSAMKMEWE